MWKKLFIFGLTLQCVYLQIVPDDIDYTNFPLPQSLNLSAMEMQETRQAFTFGNCKMVYKPICPDPDVTFFLYTKRNPENPEALRIGSDSTVSNLKETSFDASKPTKIIIHGYNSDMNLNALVEIRKEYLKTRDYNIITVDWSPLNQAPCYLSALINIHHVGSCSAQLVVRLLEHGATDIHVIGFSLGAHVANYLAVSLRPYKLPRITGLDPALPGFLTPNLDHKLDKSDASFVDVYHTNAFIQGVVEESGHVDFYLNGGALQPGCWAENRTHSIVDSKTKSIRDIPRYLPNTYPGFEQSSVTLIGPDGTEIEGYFIMNDQLARDGIMDIFGSDVENDVTFTLYNRQNPIGRRITNFNELPKHIDKSEKVKCVTHGWLSSGDAKSCILIKDAYLNATNYNVIIVDWSPVSGNVFYPIPMRATARVAEYYGKFLNYLVDKAGINPKNIHLIGHSLGAHVSGFAGRRVRKGKVGRITALDPAMPGFNIGLVEGGRLNINDAEFVDVIHTCSGYLGIRDPIGHADFYPNGGGPPQPGCTIIRLMEACSHGRSFFFVCKEHNSRTRLYGIEMSAIQFFRRRNMQR